MMAEKVEAVEMFYRWWGVFISITSLPTSHPTFAVYAYIYDLCSTYREVLFLHLTSAKVGAGSSINNDAASLRSSLPSMPSSQDPGVLSPDALDTLTELSTILARLRGAIQSSA